MNVSINTRGESMRTSPFSLSKRQGHVGLELYPESYMTKSGEGHNYNEFNDVIKKRYS